MNLSLTIAGRAFSLETSKSAAPEISASTKSVSPDVSAWLRGEDGSADGAGATLIRPYAQSAWVYIAISRLAEKIASIPFRISALDEACARRVRAVRGSSDPRQRSFRRRALGENLIECGAVCDLFNQPHPQMSRQLFWEMVVTWNCLRGEFFIVPLDGGDKPLDLAASGPRIERLLTLQPEMFWHIVQGYSLEGWRYTGSPLVSPLPSEMLLPSEVIHSRQPNPYLFWRGMSPLVVAMIAAGADYAASKYAQGYWLNNADTGVVVTTEQQTSPEQRAAILAALHERKRKAGTPDRPLFLWGGATMEKPMLSGMESQFIDNRKMNRQEIGAIFKVPESVMGFSADKASALSGGGQAITAEQQQFIESAIAPLCAQLESALDPIVRTFGPGLCGWFDLESLPVMQEARRTRLDTAVKAFAIGVPLNDVNQVYDLGFPEYPWGGKSFLPFNLQEVGANEPLPGETPPPEPPDDGNPMASMRKFLATLGRATPAQRKPATHILWESHIATRRKQVKLMESKVTKVLTQFRASTLAKLDEAHMGKTANRSLVDLLFNSHEFGATLFAQLTNPITATLQLAGNELHTELGLDDPWAMPPQKAKDFLAARKLPIQGCGETVRNQINTALQSGLDAGDSTAQLADRIRDVFKDLGYGEAKRIAMTETNMAYNDARHDAMRDAGIEYKAWLSSHGPTVRDAHALAEEVYINNPIPVDDPFEVGGEQLMYPGDDSLGASPGNVINCQCIQLAATKVAEDATSLTFKLAGFGEQKFIKP